MSQHESEVFRTVLIEEQTDELELQLGFPAYGTQLIDTQPLVTTPVVSDLFRQSQISALLQPQIVDVLRHKSVGTVVVMPIHEGRSSTVHLTLASIARQQYDHQLSIIVADNGISDSTRDDIIRITQNHNIPLFLTDALPITQDQRSPAFARNKALQDLRVIAEQDIRFRGNVLFIDGDTMLKDNALSIVEQTLLEHNKAVAVTTKTIPVNTLNENTYQKYFAEEDLGTGTTRILPPLFQNGTVDISTIVAFSGDVATKTAFLYVDRDTISDLIQRSPELFIHMPHRSGEDMILSLVLNQFGNIYYNPQAQALDQSRETSSEVFVQRMRWGTDHVILSRDLATIQCLEPGLKVLEPQGKQWIEWTVPNSDVTGAVINPEQLIIIRNKLLARINQEGYSEFASSMQIPLSLNQFLQGLALFDSVIQYIGVIRNTQIFRIRKDLPPPIDPDTTKLRWSDESRIGQFVGNMAGIQEIQSHYNSEPNHLLYGVRQAGNWDELNL